MARVIVVAAVAGVAISAVALTVVVVLVRWVAGVDVGAGSTVLIVAGSVALSFLLGRLARPWLLRLARGRRVDR